MTQEQTQDTLRKSNLAAATKIFVDALEANGVITYLVGYSLDDNPQGIGMLKMFGSSTILLNLIATIIHRSRPDEFRQLFLAMLSSDYYAAHREAAGMAGPPVASNTVN